MKKSTKGAVAASAAALLLLGGWGTQASWTDQGPVDGREVSSGKLKLTSNGCDPWYLKANVQASTTELLDLVNPQKLIPGNVLTRVCKFTVEAEGFGIKAKLSADNPTFSGSDTGHSPALALALEGATSATFSKVSGGTPIVKGETLLNNGDQIAATIAVVLPNDAVNELQSKVAKMNAFTFTITQS